jgi:uncharacterized protein YebE (UPF0316 family)
MFDIMLFVVLQLVNVILGTMRSILTIRASKNAAAVINAVSYTFYSAVVKLISGQDMIVVLAVTFATNMVGVYIAMWIHNKFKKDKVWRITVTMPKYSDSAEVTEELKKYNISNTVYIGDGVKIVDIYSKTQGESSLIKEILSKVKVKYFVTEMEKTL